MKNINDRESLIQKIIKYHTINNVDGIVLCKKCHALEHPKTKEKIAAWISWREKKIECVIENL